MNNADILKKVYAECLKECRQKEPEIYAWPEEDLNKVLGKMSIAIDRMSFNKDSSAWKLCCKRLGIKHTYQAIKAFKEGSTS